MTHRVVAGDLVIEATASGLCLSSAANSAAALQLDRAQIFKLFEVLAGFAPKSDQNRRDLFRVPLYGSEALQANVVASMKIIAAKPVNISISGMMLEISDRDIRIEPEESILVDLECGGFHYRGRAGVAWCEGDTIGVWFHDCQNFEDPTPPAELVEIVMKLQREWLMRRQQFAN